jgi:monoamine oxidase
VYKHIEFSPALPANKIAVSTTTHLGFTAKMILIYESPWWRDLGLSGALNSSVGLLAFTRDSCVEADNQYSLTCFLVGDPGRKWAEIPTPAERKANFLFHVDVMFAPAAARVANQFPSR